MPTVSTFKTSARRILKGKLLCVAVSICLWLAVYSAVCFCFQLSIFVCNAESGSWLRLVINAVAAVVELLLCAPIGFGIVRLIYRAPEHDDIRVGEIFFLFGSFKAYLKYIALRALIRLRAAVCAMPFFIACSICIGLMSRPSYVKMTDGMVAALSSCAAGFAILGLITLISLCLRSFLCDWLLVENEDKNIASILKESSRKIRSNRCSLIVLAISFIPWLLLCLTIVAIPFIIPYYITACACFARWLIKGESQ